jgi:hypothetical protein
MTLVYGGSSTETLCDPESVSDTPFDSDHPFWKAWVAVKDTSTLNLLKKPGENSFETFIPS